MTNMDRGEALRVVEEVLRQGNSDNQVVKTRRQTAEEILDALGVGGSRGGVSTSQIVRGPSDGYIGSDADQAERVRREREGLPTLEEEARLSTIINPAVQPATIEETIPQHLRDEAERRMEADNEARLAHAEAVRSGNALSRESLEGLSSTAASADTSREGLPGGGGELPIDTTGSEADVDAALAAKLGDEGEGMEHPVNRWGEPPTVIDERNAEDRTLVNPPPDDQGEEVRNPEGGVTAG